MKNLKFILILVLFFGCQSGSVENKANSSSENANEIQINKESNLSANESSKTPEPEQTVEKNNSENTAEKNIESVYTDLIDKKCKTIESNPDEGGWYRGECPGVADFKLELTEGDLRQNINIIAPNGKKFELDFNRVSGAFSAVGEKAEWRVVKDGKNIKPFALIVRFNAAEDPESPEKETSYLVVSKITDNSACITDVVKQTANANEKARELADNSANKPCKKF